MQEKYYLIRQRDNKEFCIPEYPVSISIGRGEHNTVVTTNPIASHTHVRLYTFMGQCFLDNLQLDPALHKGTFVNRQKRLESRIRLNPGDLVQLADTSSTKYGIDKGI